MKCNISKKTRYYLGEKKSGDDSSLRTHPVHNIARKSVLQWKLAREAQAAKGKKDTHYSDTVTHRNSVQLNA